MTTLMLGSNRLQIEDLERLLRPRPPQLATDAEAMEAVRAARQLIDAAMADGAVHYGINTGFGKLAGVVVPPEDLRALQVNLVRSHACGVGQPLDRSICQLAFALRIANMAQGRSGVRLALLEHAIQVFNAGIIPVLPAQGSVGASGDLAPLAHMALVLIGEGRAWSGESVVDGDVALRDAGLEPIELHSKEGLSLLNGTQVSTALLADAVLRARRLAKAADIATALTLEAYKGTDVAFDARIHDLRGHEGQCMVASNLRRLLEGSELRASHADCDRVQDNYCLRCAPQVHGATWDGLRYIEGVLIREANAVTDNPLVFPEGDILSGGNFHAQPVAVAADFLKILISELANISERRIELLVNPDLSGLPPFLAEGSGLRSGLMIAQVTAAALVSENKVLAHPASVDSISTSAGKEDHVSMATHAARQAGQIVDNATFVLAIELMSAFHGLAFEKTYKSSVGVEAARGELARVLQPLTEDRVLSGDIEAVAEMVSEGRLITAVESCLGALG
jgi:histidine ammonia-lyase